MAAGSLSVVGLNAAGVTARCRSRKPKLLSGSVVRLEADPPVGCQRLAGPLPGGAGGDAVGVPGGVGAGEGLPEGERLLRREGRGGQRGPEDQADQRTAER